MASRAKIDACKAAVLAVINGHNTFAGAFNTGASAINPLAADFPLLVPALEAISQAHIASIQKITDAQAQWNNAIPDDPVATESADGTRGATVTNAAGEVFSFGGQQSGGFTTLRNGQPWPAATPGGAVEYAYKGHQVFCKNTVGQWFTAGTLAWAVAADPFEVIPTPQTTDRWQLDELSSDGPTAVVASVGAEVFWKNIYGDYRDSNDTPQGGVPYGAFQLTPGTALITSSNIAPLIARLIPNNTGIHLHGQELTFASKERTWDGSQKPALTVTNTLGQVFNPTLIKDVGFTATSASTGGGDSVQTPGAVKFDLSVITGTVATAFLTLQLVGSSVNFGGSLSIDFLDMPMLLTDPQRQLPGSVTTGLRAALGYDEEALKTHQSIIRYNIMDAAHLKDGVDGWFHVDLFTNRQFITWPEFGNMPAIRLIAQGTNPDGSTYPASTLASYRQNFPAQDHCFLHYAGMIDADCMIGALKSIGAEGGGKLPGLVSSTGAEYFDARTMWTGPMPGNPNVSTIGFYLYSPDFPYSGASRGRHLPSTAALLYGRKGFVDVEMKLNTTSDGGVTWNRDGILRMWLDDVMVFEDLTAYLTADSLVKIDQLFFDPFHGGPDAPALPFHMEFGTTIVSTQRIGMWKPKVTQPSANWPAWRQALVGQPLNQPYRIAGTSPQRIVYKDQLAYSGVAVDDGPNTAALYTIAAGGHTINDDNRLGGINLMLDQPQWGTLIQPSPYETVSQHYGTGHDVTYYPDGTPVSGHTYFLSFVLRQYKLGVRLVGTATNPYSNGGGACDGANLLTNQWLPAFTLPPKPYHPERYQLVVATAAKHPITEDIYYQNFGDGQVFQASTKTWLDLGDMSYDMWGYTGSVIDGQRNTWAIVGDNKLKLRNLATFARTDLPLQGAPADVTGSEGMTHDTNGDKYWIAHRWPSGVVGAYTVGPADAVVTHKFDLPDSGPGPANRLAMLPALGGMVYVPWEGDLIFIPTA